MGHSCSRRASSLRSFLAPQPAAQDNEPWVLVQEPVHRVIPNRHRLRARWFFVIRLVSRLLKLRAHWARQGHLLNQFSTAFNHLERVRGRLHYRRRR